MADLQAQRDGDAAALAERVGERDHALTRLHQEHETVVTGLRLALAEREESLRELESGRDADAKAHRGQRDADLAALRERLHGHEAALERLDGDHAMAIAELQARLTERERAIETMTADHQADRDALETRLAAQEADRRALEVRAAERATAAGGIDAERRELLEEIEALRRDHGALVRALDEAREAETGLHSRVEQLETARDEAARRAADDAQVRAGLERQMAELERLRTATETRAGDGDAHDVTAVTASAPARSSTGEGTVRQRAPHRSYQISDREARLREVALSRTRSRPSSTRINYEQGLPARPRRSRWLPADWVVGLLLLAVGATVIALVVLGSLRLSVT